MAVEPTFPAFGPAFGSAFGSALVHGAVQRNNVLLDHIVYDVAALSAGEREWLVREETVEGSVLVVHPSASGRGVTKFETCRRMQAAPGTKLRAFSIAGVGSSDLGAAALARTVADHLGEPVGAVVAGNGLQGAALEGLHGYFGLGAGQWTGTLPFAAPLAASWEQLTRQSDTAALADLLDDPGRQIRCLVGHSKGALSIAAALRMTARRQRLRDAPILTLGVAAAMPEEMRAVRQFLGAFDWFGRVNSSPRASFEAVSGAMHHLNPGLPFHLDAAACLRMAIPVAGEAP